MNRKKLSNTYITKTMTHDYVIGFVSDAREEVILQVTCDDEVITSIPLTNLYDMITDLIWKMPKKIISWAVSRRVKNLRLMCANEAAMQNLAKWENKDEPEET